LQTSGLAPGRSGFASTAQVLLIVILQRLIRPLERLTPKLGEPPSPFELFPARLLHE